jgi:predicted transcriptional regulator
MRKNEFKEGLGDLAHAAEQDHEVQMARAELYKIAKYAIKLHDMLKGVSEAEGLEGWQQSKITKAADYIGSVYHNLEYEMKFGDGGNAEIEPQVESSYKDSLKSKLDEKAKSKAQQRFMGMVYAAKKGEKPASKEVAKVAKGMSKSDAKDFASTKHKGKPEHVKKKKKD